MLNFDAHTDPPSFIWLCYKLVPYKYNYTEQNYKRNTFLPQFSWAELKDLRLFSMYTKGPFLSNIVHKSV